MSHSWRRDQGDADRVGTDEARTDGAPDEARPVDGRPAEGTSIDGGFTADAPTGGATTGGAGATSGGATDDAGGAMSPFAPGQPFAGAGGPPHTGDPGVDAALAGAAAAQDLEPAEQLEVYVGTHRALQDRLADSGA